MALGYTTGDMEPSLSGTLKNGTVAVDLTTATTVTVHIKYPDSTVLSKVAVIGDQVASPGTWTATWNNGDLVQPGKHLIEVEVTWPGVRPQTFGPGSFKVFQAIQ